MLDQMRRQKVPRSLSEATGPSDDSPLALGHSPWRLHTAANTSAMHPNNSPLALDHSPWRSITTAGLSAMHPDDSPSALNHSPGRSITAAGPSAMLSVDSPLRLDHSPWRLNSAAGPSAMPPDDSALKLDLSTASMTQHCSLLQAAARCRHDVAHAEPEPNLGQVSCFSLGSRCTLKASASSAFTKFSGSVAHASQAGMPCDQVQAVHEHRGQIMPRPPMPLGGLGTSPQWLHRGGLRGQAWGLPGLPVHASPGQGNV